MAPRLLIYGSASTVLAAAVVGAALHTRANFYAAAVAVGRSSGALMVLANFLFLNVICVGMIVKTIFFGRLRAIEYEHLFERLWMFLTESLLALTIFRDDFSAPFAVMYGVLVFLKCFHWITADRVDYMDQIPPPGPPVLFHVRLSVIIAILTLFDSALVTYTLDTILADGVSAMVLFASEFMILFASVGGITARYVVGLVDLRRARGRADAPSWEMKSMYLFYVDLAVDFVKLLTYLSFFCVILLNYGLPLHILRDVYMTLRSFLGRCRDLIRYRQATKDMDALYPNATPEEMDRLGDKTCIICREEMVVQSTEEGQAPPAPTHGPNETPKKLACGHIFHFHCLRSWLERQQSCPTCRRDVLRNPIAPVTRHAPGAPAPAPGARPQPPGLLPNGAAEPLQAMYNQYFRLPQANVRPPVPGVTPVPEAVPAVSGDGRTVPIAGSQSAAPPPETDAQKLQRGIWGVAVTPGRFFPSPLGETSRHSGRSSTVVGNATQTTLRAPRAPSSAVSTQIPASPSSTIPTTTASSSAAAASPTPTGISGPTTQCTSHLPQISTPAGTSGTDVNGESDGKRAAAEAAMRRMGPRDSVIPTTPLAHAEDLKGKGKAVVPAKEADAFDSPPRYIPYLSTGLPPPHPSISAAQPWIPRLRSPHETRTGLDQRIRTLREIDDAMFGMLGELTRLRSQWETEDVGDEERGRKDDRSLVSEGS